MVCGLTIFQFSSARPEDRAYVYPQVPLQRFSCLLGLLVALRQRESPQRLDYWVTWTPEGALRRNRLLTTTCGYIRRLPIRGGEKISETQQSLSAAATALPPPGS